MQRIVVLGTGTAVGKTHVSVEIIRAVRRTAPSRPIVALKPIETGGGQGPSDAERLAGAVGAPLTEPLYRFESPVSPHLAARRSREIIDVGRVAAWISEIETISHSTTSDVMPFSSSAGLSLIETAGGLFSPLSPLATNYDLACALKPAIWVLVAPDALGVLHDVRAALLALERCGGRVDHLVLSAARPADASTGTNAAELEALGVAHASAVFGVDHVEGLERFVSQLLT